MARSHDRTGSWLKQSTSASSPSLRSPPIPSALLAPLRPSFVWFVTYGLCVTYVCGLRSTNKGGAVADRTSTKEQYNIAVLRYQWPGVFPQHGTRGEDEVRMSWGNRGTILGGKNNVRRLARPAGYQDSDQYGGGPPKTKQKSIASFFGAATAPKKKAPKTEIATAK